MIVIANYEQGQIVTRKQDRLPSFDEVRAGWVVVHEAKPPEFRILVEGGQVRCVASDNPRLKLLIVDADAAKDTDKAVQGFMKSTEGLFVYDQRNIPETAK